MLQREIIYDTISSAKSFLSNCALHMVDILRSYIRVRNKVYRNNNNAKDTVKVCLTELLYHENENKMLDYVRHR